MDFDFKTPRNAPAPVAASSRFPWLLALLLSIVTLVGLFYLYPGGSPLQANTSAAEQATLAPPPTPEPQLATTGL